MTGTAVERKAVAFEGIGFGEVDGVIEGIAAVTGNVDRARERIRAGAFTKTISERKAKIPLGLDHEHGFGVTIDMAEVGRDDLPARIRAEAPDATGGLWCKGQVVLSDDNIVRLERMREATRAGRPPGMSITYRVIAEEKARLPGGDVRDLLEVALNEWGPLERRRAINGAAMVTEVKGTSAPGSKADLAGTFEQLSTRVMDAVRGTSLVPENGYVYPVGTYADHVVVTVGAADGPDASFSVPYALVGEEVILGQPTPIELQLTAVPVAEKAAEIAGLMAVVERITAEMKAGRVIRAELLTVLDDALKALQRIRAAADGSDDSPADTAAKADAGSASTSPPAQRPDLAVRMRAAEMAALLTRARIASA